MSNPPLGLGSRDHFRTIPKVLSYQMDATGVENKEEITQAL